MGGLRRRNARRAVAIAAAALLALTAGAAPGAASRAPASLHPCKPGGRVLCGTIRVPLYRALPALGSLLVSFRMYPRTDPTAPALEPVVAMEGGPGYPSIGSASTYRFMLGPLNRRHDLIVMDQRGTGRSSPIACPALQQGIGSYEVATRRCARRLGMAAGAYGSAAVGADLADVLHSIGVARVDVYGDSYGTYAAQAFALQHPGMVRALVLDGAFDQNFDPFEREASASLRHAWQAVCRRSRACSGARILGRIRALDGRLARRPLTGVSRDADGYSQHVRLTARGFAQLVFDATYYDTVFRDLPAAMDSLAHGDQAPMLRLAAEDATANEAGGAASAYSAGDYAAVACHDYPALWDVHAGLAARRSQLAAAEAGVGSNAFAPFRKSVWLASLDEDQLVRGCIRWPAPPVRDPAFPPAPRPDLHVLVLNGEFDQATPVADARRAAGAFPHAVYVQVASTGHITALADFQRCASAIARRFLQTLAAGDARCASRMPAQVVMPSFPVRLPQAPQLRAAGADDRSTKLARQAAWVGSETVGDAYARWYSDMYGTLGHGLRGGSYRIAGGYLSGAPLVIDFRGDRLTADLAATGSASWNRRTLVTTAVLRMAGPAASGMLRVDWSTLHPGRGVRVTGDVNGRRVDLRGPAPWVPHG
jgi:pimeloyl-ACP methyl ester carboxylesterase